jgi:hypothetical protein
MVLYAPILRSDGTDIALSASSYKRSSESIRTTDIDEKNQQTRNCFGIMWEGRVGNQLVESTDSMEQRGRVANQLC